MEIRRYCSSGLDFASVFPTAASLTTDPDVVRVGADMLPRGLPRHSVPSPRHLSAMQQAVSAVLDLMGDASAIAQDLKSAITTGEKVRMHPEHSVYLLLDREANLVLGLLKVGRKKLFLLDEAGEQHEECPMCVLDFYVHESRQRSGCGRRLFEAMLADQGEGLHPANMAVDRPSPKLIGFLKKYYGLAKTIPQVRQNSCLDIFK